MPFVPKVWTCLWLPLVASAWLVSGCEGTSPDAPKGETTGPVIVAPGHVSGERTLMGTRFAIQVVTPDERAGVDAITAALDEVARVESRISSWRDDSEMTAINNAAGQAPVTIGADLLTVLSRAQEISRLTAGAFDITFAACGGLWDYDAAVVPTDEQLAACLVNVDFRALQLDPSVSTARLSRAKMRAGLGAIGKGYGIDRAAELLEARGIQDYIVDGGGDVRLSGTKHGQAWKVGVAHPRKRGQIHATLSIEGGAVVTSGDYERYFDADGRRYHHILDPRTGRPAEGATAVTVVARTAMDADALATGLFVLGATDGLALARTLPDTEAWFVDLDMNVHATPNFPALHIVEPL